MNRSKHLGNHPGNHLGTPGRNRRRNRTTETPRYSTGTAAGTIGNQHRGRVGTVGGPYKGTPGARPTKPQSTNNHSDQQFTHAAQPPPGGRCHD